MNTSKCKTQIYIPPCRRTKLDVTDMMDFSGWKLKKSELENVGEWNENFKWLAVKGKRREILEVVPKGHRASWNLIHLVFEQLLSKTV